MKSLTVLLVAAVLVCRSTAAKEHRSRRGPVPRQVPARSHSRAPIQSLASIQSAAHGQDVSRNQKLVSSLSFVSPSGSWSSSEPPFRAPKVPPRAAASLCMAASLALHYLAYSLARPATMTLFTSSKLGFGSASLTSAYPLAMALVSPASFVLLLLYGEALERAGPASALQLSTLACAAALVALALALIQLPSTTLTKYLVGALFVFRESYVQLLTSQHWSFLSSILTPTQSSRWFAPISGLTSVTSALAAVRVGDLTDRLWGGLCGVVLLAGTVLAVSVVLGAWAYTIAERNGFSPAQEHRRKKKPSIPANKKEDRSTGSDNNSNHHGSLTVKAKDVFTRVPTLWALFCEILACQGLSTVLNVACVTKVSEVIVDDSERAGWMGKFFATVNVLSGILQFGILPATSSLIEPSLLWRSMPLLMLIMTCLLIVPTYGTRDPSLQKIASAFMVMKTMEFSVRRMLDEMVYVPLDYESRYLGKEVIGVLGYRFGKSAASLALSALTFTLGTSTVGLGQLSYFAIGAAALWLGTAWRLSHLVPTRKEAEEAYQKMKRDAAG